MESVCRGHAHGVQTRRRVKHFHTPMKKDTYFSELRSHLGTSAEADRFVQELQDHVEDSRENDAEHSSDQSLGDLALLASSFHHYMMRKNFIRDLSETLFVSLLSLPLFLVMIVVANEIGRQFIYADIPVSIYDSGVLYTGIIVLISFVLLTSLFFSHPPRVFVEFPFWPVQFPWALLLFGFPIIVLLFKVWSITSVEQDLSSFLLTTAGLILTSSIGCFLLAVRQARKDKTHRILKPLKKYVRPVVGYAILLLTLVHSLIVLGSAASPSFDAWISQVMSELPSLQATIFFLNIVETIAMNIILQEISNIGTWWTYGQYWILGTFITLLVIAGAIQLISFFKAKKPRRFSWLITIIVVQGITLLSLGSPTPLTIQPTVPSYHLSKAIGHQQLGPFYRLAMYINGFNAVYGRYYVTRYEGKFMLYQTDFGGETFFLDNITDTEHFSLWSEPWDGGFPDAPYTDWTSIDQRFECHGASLEIEMNQGFDCHILTLNGKEIFRTRRDRVWVNRLEVSEDYNWAVIVLAHNIDGGNEMYLLDLRSLTSDLSRETSPLTL